MVWLRTTGRSSDCREALARAARSLMLYVPVSTQTELCMIRSIVASA